MPAASSFSPAPAPVPSAVAIIPARLGSTRFPGKMLAAETGRPLVVHVCEAAARASSVDRVVVATDHEEIRRVVEAAGFRAVMTSPEHPNGTARLAEASAVLGLSDDQVVVNVQGDEPEIEPGVVDAAVGALLAVPSADCATVASPFGAGDDPGNPNVVKAVGTARPGQPGEALYFSRAAIPFHRDGPSPAAGELTGYLRHIGIYAYRVRFLREYVGWRETPLERAERLEQLRILEHGRRIALAVVDARHEGIDTPEQYAAFVARWRGGVGG